MVWAEVDTEDPKTVDVEISIYGTGWELPEDMGFYINTILDGDFVWHVLWKRI